jgi:hypothetical protein
MICHRNGGSGCKTALNGVLNKILKHRGIKINMNWMPPIADKSESNYDIEKISLICEEHKSSDIADEINKSSKKIQIKELTLSLNQGRFPQISNVLKKYQIREITKETALKDIKRELNDESYNNASVLIKIGHSKKRVSWDDLEGLIDGFDITDKVHGLKGTEFIKQLKISSDEFLFSLLNKRN